MTHSSEQDKRIEILNSFLTTPHRDIKAYHGMHKTRLEEDPEFYGRLAVWYMKNGDVRDHQDLFTAMLISSHHPGHRNTGLNFFRNLEPYRVARVVDFYKKNISKSLPNAMRSELKYYFWEREMNRKQLDGAILRARKSMRNLMIEHKIPRSEYLHQVLFDGNPPVGSVHHNLKRIANEENPSEQARMILENDIPFTTAVSVLKKITPSALVAIINGMSPQDVINNLSSLEKKGALSDKRVEGLIKEKLQAAKTNNRVSAGKVRDAKKSAKLSQENTQLLDEVADTQIKKKGRIGQSTALFVDKSSSLTVAIEVAKQLGVLVSSIMEEGVPLHVVAFDRMPYPIAVRGSSYAAWDAAFTGIKADGMTSCGAALELLIRQKVSVEQIILITDADENTSPFFVNSYKRYEKEIGSSPHVILVKVGRHIKKLENEFTANKIEFDVYEVGAKSDKYSLTGIIPYLSRRSKLDVLMDIMSENLLERKPAVPMPQIVREHQVKRATA